MEITLAPGGQYTHSAPQQQWHGDSPHFQTALFAGQKLMVIRESDESPVYELHFMNLMTTGFASMEDAKKAAPDFARSVFDRLKSKIQD
ncbi:hypothetical protein P5704_027785 (plasmid) [Pseudomonas sp. FeN3W]|nr:hypothetical protein P5704_027785 [Pseudomonas sp. FeN3W]